MRKLTATLCLTFAALFICATVKNANAEDKFYAFVVNEKETTWEAVLTIKGKTAEATITILDCPFCYRRGPVSAICEKTEISQNNDFETWCTGIDLGRASEESIDAAKLIGNVKIATANSGGAQGTATFHFIPYSQKKAFEISRQKTQATSTSAFAKALANPQKVKLARMLREQDPAAVARAAEERARELEAAARRARAEKKAAAEAAARRVRERAEAAERRARELEAAARRARAEKKAAAEAAARQAKIEAARLKKLAAEAREADARARAAEAEATAKLEAARKTAEREREAELARMEEQRKAAEAERRSAEARAAREAMRLEDERRTRLARLTVGLRPENSYYQIAKSSAKLRLEPDRKSKTLQTLKMNEQVHVVGILPSGWAQVADEGEPVGWIYRASLRETGRGAAGYQRPSSPVSSQGSALFAQNYPFPKGKVNPEAVAVLIGNRDYSSRDIPPVDFAHNDLEVMRQFVTKTLGYRPGNVFVEKNASKAVFEKYFGNRYDHRGRISDTITGSGSDVFVYVSGHGVPSEDKDGYLLPVDGDPDQVRLTGYNVRTLVENMNRLSARQVTIALDTCFSGISQRGSLIKGASGIYIRPKFEALGRVTLLTAASGKQTASWDTGAQLGLFTRYFVEGMLGRADTDSGNGNGSIELFELKDFLASKVGYQARRRYSRTQIPEVMGRLDRVMSASLDPRFSFGDPDLEGPLSRNQRPANRSFRADDRSAPPTQTPPPASQEEPSLLDFLLQKSNQNEEENEYND